jgi:hypothetical protein
MKSNTFKQKTDASGVSYAYVRRSAPGNHLSALADYERSPAIHRRDPVQDEHLVA